MSVYSTPKRDQCINVFSCVCVCVFKPHLERLQCGPSEGTGGQQGGGQACLRTRCCHQALAVDEEVDERVCVRSLHQDHRLGLVVQAHRAALFMTGGALVKGCY